MDTQTCLPMSAKHHGTFAEFATHVQGLARPHHPPAVSQHTAHQMVCSSG